MNDEFWVAKSEGEFCPAWFIQPADESDYTAIALKNYLAKIETKKSAEPIEVVKVRMTEIK
jgi:hypothetical protein